MNYRRSSRIRLVVSLASIGILSSLFWTATDANASEIRWLNDLQTAHKFSVESGRPLLLHFWAPWCGPCNEMERTTFTDPNVVRLLGDYYIPVKLNFDHPTSKQIAAQYNVQNGIPADVIVSPDGRVLARSASRLDAPQYTAMLTQVVAMLQSPTMVQSPPPQTTSTRNPHPAMQPQGSNFMPGSTRNVSFPQNVNRGSFAGNQAQQQPFEQGIPAQNVAVNPQQNIPPQQGPYGVQQGPYGVSSNPPFAVQPQVENPGVNQPVQPQPQPQQFVQAPVQPQQLSPQVQTPPSYGLEGFCPVELLQNEKWVTGDLRYGAVHQGITYLFAGPEQQRQFLANPDRYAPANRGFDIVLSTEMGQNIPGKRRHGVFLIDGQRKQRRIYLFASEATLKKFQEQLEIASRQAAGGMQPNPPQQNVVPNQNYVAPPNKPEQAAKPWWYR